MTAAGTADLFAPLGTRAPSMLMAGIFDSYSTGAGLAAGFRALGWDVAEVSILDSLIMSDLPALRVMGKAARVFATAGYNRAILAACDKVRPQVMLTVKGSYITAATLHELERRGIRTVNFYPDRDFAHVGSRDDALDAYGLVVTTKSYQLDYLRDRLGKDRAAFVHHGYVQGLHRRRTPAGETPQFLWDVSYIGNADGAKLDWLAALARARPELDMIVIGNRWRALARGTPIERFVFGGELLGDHFARVAEHSRINLAVHYGSHEATGWRDLVSTRTFEIPACGGFMLHVDNEELRSLYAPGEECGAFSTQDDMVDQVTAYLDDDTRRVAIADRGHARTVPAYSLATRAAEMAAIIGPN